MSGIAYKVTLPSHNLATVSDLSRRTNIERL